MLKKKIWANFQRIVEVFTQKFSKCSQIHGFGIRDPQRHRIPDPQHCLYAFMQCCGYGSEWIHIHLVG
jgi:hypothetical protein